jgi:thiol-disulfide isomerase/thioredoxin
LRLKVVLFLFIAWLVSGCSEQAFHLADKSNKKLSDYHGQWLLINYWAAWCKPCIHEIPELNLLDEEPDIQVFGYNFDGLSGHELKNEISRFGLRYPSFLEPPAALFDQTQPSGIPASMLIDAEGEFRLWLMGPQTKASIMAVIRELQSD